MTPTDDSIAFLPHLLRGFLGLTNASVKAGRIEASIELRIPQNPAQGTVHRDVILRGPGDILNIHPRSIARLEPGRGSTDFEPNYFPFVEFVDPDFLWRYSLVPDANRTRAHPWLSLIALTAEEIDEMKREGIEVTARLADDRELLSVRGDLMLSLDQAWALAHVHLNGFEPGEDLEEFIEDYPASHCCRLFCCRHLLPETNYEVFLVPNYQIAVDSALRIPDSEAGGAMAWGNLTRSDVIRLPVYHRWSFATSQKGDFEQMARQLEAIAIESDRVGTRAVDARSMGESSASGALFFLREGALVAPGYSTLRATYAEAAARLPLTDPLIESLNESLAFAPPESDPSSAEADDMDPLVTFPTYGRHYRKTETIERPQNNAWPQPSPWIHELNLDFRYRVSAGFGTSVVQQNQDEYMRTCWYQVGQIREANERKRRAKIAHLLGQVLDRKHLKPLSDDRFAQVTQPFHAHIATHDQAEGQSFQRAFADSGLVAGVLSPTLRRVAHQRIGIQRTRPSAPWMKATQAEGQLLRARPPQPRRLDALSATLPAGLPGIEGAAPTRLAELVPVKPIDLSAEFRPRVDFRLALQSRLAGAIQVSSDDPVTEDFDPIMRSPHVDEAMYRPLARLSNDYLIPGIESLGNNGVALLEENPRFIEAYMAGLNHEMIRELVWQGFPTDKRGTVMRYFWDAPGVEDGSPDIPDIHRWEDALGANRPAEKSSSLVLLIKGDLIRRYPGMQIYAVRITSRTAGRWMFWTEAYPDNEIPENDDAIIDPVFRAAVGTDIQMVGFPFSGDVLRGAQQDGEYYFVLQENHALPRFGLDVQSTGTRRPELIFEGPLLATPVAPAPPSPPGTTGGFSSALTAGDAVVVADFERPGTADAVTEGSLTAGSVTGPQIASPAGDVSTDDSGPITGRDLGWNDIPEDDMRARYIDRFTVIGGNSARVAARTYQKPIRVVIHSSHMLPSDSTS